MENLKKDLKVKNDMIKDLSAKRKELMDSLKSEKLDKTVILEKNDQDKKKLEIKIRRLQEQIELVVNEKDYYKNSLKDV